MMLCGNIWTSLLVDLLTCDVWSWQCSSVTSAQFPPMLSQSSLVHLATDEDDVAEAENARKFQDNQAARPYQHDEVENPSTDDEAGNTSLADEEESSDRDS